MYPGIMRKGKRSTVPKGKGKVKEQEDEEDVDEDDYEGGQEIDDEERDFFRRELDAIGWGLAGVRIGDGTEDVAFGEEAIGVNGGTKYVAANGAGGIGLDQSGAQTQGQVPAPQPQWITPDATSIENWQNS